MAHSPRELGRLQAMHGCPQAEVQQSPSTQNPVWHSSSQLQDSAFPLDLLTVPGEQTLVCWASAVPEPSEALASFFPPSSVPLPPSTPTLPKVLFVQPPAPKTAHKARAPQNDP